MSLIKEILNEKSIEREKINHFTRMVSSCFDDYLLEIKEYFKFVEYDAQKVNLNIDYCMADFGLSLKNKGEGRFTLYHGTNSCITKSQDLEELNINMSQTEVKAKVEKSIKWLLKSIL
ncbi:hypothetical protein [Paenibacillus xylaniclasticus]|uniref:hypothetical protein n=1 Tax=Paenibacillus xylaniclasticus TaxID=588083 RepID=UPI000FD80596|nr:MULTISPECIES: hypothetical protein [Paenibacillus]GFN32489.1 hypothetical protein PCURB6_27490 [Paenibacillus curdlanolyticus]